MATKIGKNILENLMEGMYTDARVAYREYIQNATDQIDIALEKNSFPDEELEVNITIDKNKRTILIEDNANGIPKADVAKTLGDIADSQKIQGENKGFRGIGRLGGVAYCKTLKFITSYQGEDEQTIMTWNGELSREIVRDKSNHDSAEEVLSKIITYTYEPCSKEKHFFRVEMIDVNSQNDNLLDVKNIRQYLREVAPVPFKDGFIWKSKIDDFIKSHDEVPDMDVYTIQMREKGKDLIQIYKEYPSKVYEKVGNDKKAYDDITNIHADIIRDTKGKAIAWIWYAITRFSKQIPENVNEWRGLRLRQFNILIGDKNTLSESPKFFKESRGNGYFLGEVHTINKELRPNARRDYFNETKATKDLEIALQEYMNKYLYPLYYAGSKLNSSYTKIVKLRDMKEEYSTKEKTGFSTPEAQQELKAKLDAQKIVAKEAAKVIEKFTVQSNDTPTSAVAEMVKAVNKNRKKEVYLDASQIKQQVETLIDEPKKEDKKKKEKTVLLVDVLSKYPKSERKLISRIYGVIRNQLANDEAEALIGKIQEELK